MVDLLWHRRLFFRLSEACLGNTLASRLSATRRRCSLLPVRPEVFACRHWEPPRWAMPDRDARRARLAGSPRTPALTSGGAGLKREVKELFYDSAC
jgi:hypothetical protein